MRYNLKQEYCNAMDEISFSPKDQALLAEKLVAKGKEQTMYQPKHQNHPKRFRKIMILAAALTVLLATLTGAAVFTHWSRTAQTVYQPSQQIKEQAEKTGLSDMLETKDAQAAGDVLSATDQGITVTAVQSIVDNYGGEITFRIEGFDPGEKQPWAFESCTIDDQADFFVSYGGTFFDGTTYNDAGQWVYAADGSPVKFDNSQPDSPVILDYVAEDGSLEYTCNFRFQEGDGRYLGKEIRFHFTGFGVASDEKAGEAVKEVEGSWDLHWTLQGADVQKDGSGFQPNAEIGSLGITLLEAQIGQKSLVMSYKTQEYWDGWETLETFPAQLYGVRMKDGSIVRTHVRTSGYADEENLLYYEELTTVDGILDLGQMEALLYRNTWDQGGDSQAFFEIPISQ